MSREGYCIEKKNKIVMKMFLSVCVCVCVCVCVLSLIHI